MMTDINLIYSLSERQRNRSVSSSGSEQSKYSAGVGIRRNLYSRSLDHGRLQLSGVRG